MSFLFARQCIIKCPINYYFSSEGTFDFKKNCLFCDEVCDVEPDKKNPEKFKKTLVISAEQLIEERISMEG
jgi:ferredoxin-like protein FixX